MKSFLVISLIVLTSLAAIPSAVNAWGTNGHQTVGQIAQNILRSDIANKVAQLLQDESFGGQLAPASTWADKVKRRFPWSSSLHYMDTHDNPGKSCSVNPTKDCPGDICLVGAIVNYTTQLDCKNGYDTEARDIALRFLTHYIGDLTQPLHVSGRDKGGNNVMIRWGRRKAKLHAIWDTEMVNKRLEDFNSDYVEYSKYLTLQIRNGTYATEAASWISCLGRALTKQCVFSWAADTNKINCPFVWDTVDENPEIDLSKGYYKAAAPIIDKQLAKGGYRLGTLVNLILGKNC